MPWVNNNKGYMCDGGCGTGQTVEPRWDWFRCYYCKKWFCEKCAEKHFGDTKQELERLVADEDREQFAQLIGYSLSGFADLSYVSNKTYNAADAQPVHKK